MTKTRPRARAEATLVVRPPSTIARTGILIEHRNRVVALLSPKTETAPIRRKSRAQTTPQEKEMPFKIPRQRRPSVEPPPCHFGIVRIGTKARPSRVTALPEHPRRLNAAVLNPRQEWAPMEATGRGMAQSGSGWIVPAIRTEATMGQRSQRFGTNSGRGIRMPCDGLFA